MSKLLTIAESIERFAAEADPEPGYHMQHRAPGKEGAPLHDLTENDVYPSDVYSTLEQYRDYNDGDLDSMSVIRRAKGKPEARFKIYRAIPAAVYKDFKKKYNAWWRRNKNKNIDDMEFAPDTPIHAGDWVTLSEKYAKQHAIDLEGTGNDGKVVSKMVYAKQVWTDGNSVNEWGYWP